MDTERNPGHAARAFWRVVCATGLAAGAFLTPPLDSRLAAQGTPSGLVPIFSTLEGSWEGSGMLLGRRAAFEMSWETGTSGFVRLSFSNAWVEEGGGLTPVLSARATYLVDGASASGVWIDDRPQRLRLEAAVSDSSVVTKWTGESETGRTEYIVRSPESVIVRDFVVVEGTDRLFAEATYHRASKSPSDGPAG